VLDAGRVAHPWTDAPLTAGLMKSFLRFTLALLTAASLLLCVATLAVWLRSYDSGSIAYRVPQNGWTDERHFAMRTVGVGCIKGQLGCFRTSLEADDKAKLWGFTDSLERNPAISPGWHRQAVTYPLAPLPSGQDLEPHWRNGFGFHALHHHEEAQMDFMQHITYRDPKLPWIVSDARAISVPCWLVLLVCLPLTIRGSRGLIKRLGRRKPGLCRSCGYDLRATPDRCPECGEPAAKA
jgi:hypothetical protein